MKTSKVRIISSGGGKSWYKDQVGKIFVVKSDITHYGPDSTSDQRDHYVYEIFPIDGRCITLKNCVLITREDKLKRILKEK